MEQKLKSNSLHAFDMIRAHAAEYNRAEYKFYQAGFVKFVREGRFSILIEELYIIPEFRGTPVARIMMSSFEEYLRDQNIVSYFGRVFKGDEKNYHKRMKTFLKWGVEVVRNTDYYTLIRGQVNEKK